MANTSTAASPANTSPSPESAKPAAFDPMAFCSALTDGDIYFGVAGYNAVLPASRVDALSPAQLRLAAMIGLNQVGLRRMQTVAKHAVANKDNVTIAVNKALADFVPPANTGFQTVGEKRRELAAAYVREGLQAAGKSVTEDRVLATVESIFAVQNETAERHRAKVNERLAKWLMEYTPPATRSAGSTSANGEASAEDLDSF